VWLSGDFSALYERALRGGDRPMLSGKTREQAQALYETRKAFYGKADLTVDTTALNPDQVAARVASALVERLQNPPHPALSPSGGEGPSD
jgi:shikimate kinase